jgi:hypothetical protein
VPWLGLRPCGAVSRHCTARSAFGDKLAGYE